MRSDKIRTIVGIGMIIGSIPCTLAGFLLWHFTVALAEGRAAGRDVGFDLIGVLMASYFAFLLSLGTCLAGVLYIGYAVLKQKARLRTWHLLGIAYAVIQVAIALAYMLK